MNYALLNTNVCSLEVQLLGRDAYHMFKPKLRS